MGRVYNGKDVYLSVKGMVEEGGQGGTRCIKRGRGDNYANITSFS